MTPDQFAQFTAQKAAQPAAQETAAEKKAKLRTIRRNVAKAARDNRGRPDRPPAEPTDDGAFDAPRICWADEKDFQTVALGRNKTKLSAVELEIAEAKRDVEIGKLVPREQVQEREAKIGELFRDGLASLVDLVSDWVPANKIIDAQTAFRDRADMVLNDVADGVK
jgi:hypothetical protein